MDRQNNETFFSFCAVLPKIYEDCGEIHSLMVLPAVTPIMWLPSYRYTVDRNNMAILISFLNTLICSHIRNVLSSELAFYLSGLPSLSSKSSFLNLFRGT